MLFTIIIPTRERCETLEHALRTCVHQSYDELQILISDNCSKDDTREVVESLRDCRVKYVNTGKRVSMSSNWEFAMSHVQKGYVTFLGDDDGLLPGAIEDLAGLIQDTGARTLSWSSVLYFWPASPGLENYVRIPLRNKLLRVSSNLLAKHLVSHRLPYWFGPCLYTGVVDHQVIKKIKEKTGRFFGSVTPDCYSALAVLSESEYHYFSTRPFGVSGLSSRSNGLAFSRSADLRELGPEARLFFSEIDMPVHPKIDLMPGSLESGISEAFLQANDACFGGRLNLDLKTILDRIVQEYSRKDPETYHLGIAHVDKLASRLGLSAHVALLKRRHPNKPRSETDLKCGLDEFLALRLGTGNLHVQNVYDCSMLAGEILGPYSMPPWHTYSMIGRLAAWLHRRTDRMIMW
jgi:glycosyltransferase involved in cell wall biosynthesis